MPKKLIIFWLATMVAWYLIKTKLANSSKSDEQINEYINEVISLKHFLKTFLIDSYK